MVVRWLHACLLGAACAIAGCVEPKVGAPQAVRAECPALTESDYYFPVGALIEQSPDDANFSADWDASRRERYSAYLAAMDEPSLSCGPDDSSEVYRFMWLPWIGNPTMVRIESRDGVYAMTTIQLSNPDGYEIGEVTVRREVTMNSVDGEVFAGALEHAQFWNTPTLSERDCEGLLDLIEDIKGVRVWLCTLMGTDGTRWIFEGRRGGDYHVIDRHDPDFLYPEPNVRIVALGEAVVNVSGVDIHGDGL